MKPIAAAHRCPTARPNMLRAFAIFLAFASAWATASGQSQPIRFDGGGVTNASKSAVLVAGGSPVGATLDMDAHDQIRVNFQTGTFNAEAEISVKIAEDCFQKSANIEFGTNNPDVSFKSTGRFIFKPIGPGPANITIYRVKVGEGYVTLPAPVSFNFQITSSKQPSNPPPTDKSTTDPPTQQPEPKTNPSQPAAKSPAANKPEPKKDPVQEAYDKAIAQSGEARETALLDFLEKHPATPLAAEAKKKVPIQASAVPGAPPAEQQFELRFAIEPAVDSTTIPAGAQADIQYQNGVFILTVRLTGNPPPFDLRVNDPGKEAAAQTPPLPISGKPLTCTLGQKDQTTATLRLEGGAPPFIIEFLQENEQFREKDLPVLTTDTTIEIKHSWLRGVGKPGDFAVRVRKKRSVLVYNVNGKITVTPPDFPWPYLLAALGALAALLGIVQLRKNMQRRTIEAKIKKNKYKQLDPATVQPGTTIASGNLKISIPAASQAADRGLLTAEAFDALLAQGGHYMLSPRLHFPDSALAELHFSHHSIQGIDEFLRNQRQQMREESEGTIPEIGGFLLGKYSTTADSPNGTTNYRAALEEFVPIVPEDHNVYQLEFSTASLVQELGDMQDKYPDLSLVGWFHTHPGHGLFLSKPDLTIHDGFFKEPYQFAMEIDSLTPNLDTGFFTRKASGQVNNQEDNEKRVPWFAWTNVATAASGSPTDPVPEN